MGPARPSHFTPRLPPFRLACRPLHGAFLGECALLDLEWQLWARAFDNTGKGRRPCLRIAIAGALRAAEPPGPRRAVPGRLTPANWGGYGTERTDGGGGGGGGGC